MKCQSHSLLKEKPHQQIWRDHLLALCLFITNDDTAKIPDPKMGRI